MAEIPSISPEFGTLMDNATQRAYVPVEIRNEYYNLKNRERALLEEEKAGLEINSSVLKRKLCNVGCAVETINLGIAQNFYVKDYPWFIMIGIPGTSGRVWIDKQDLRDYLPFTAVRVDMEYEGGIERFVRFPCFDVDRDERMQTEIINRYTDLTIPLDMFKIVIAMAEIDISTLPGVK